MNRYNQYEIAIRPVTGNRSQPWTKKVVVDFEDRQRTWDMIDEYVDFSAVRGLDTLLRAVGAHISSYVVTIHYVVEADTPEEAKEVGMNALHAIDKIAYTEIEYCEEDGG